MNRHCFVCFKNEPKHVESDIRIPENEPYRCSNCLDDFEVFTEVMNLILERTDKQTYDKLYSPMHVYFTGRDPYDPEYD